MTEGGSQRPRGPGRRRASVLQLELPCATLDEVRDRHPELRSRRFQLRTDEPKPLDTMLVLDVRLAGGTPCFRATSVVERVHGAPEPGMTLWLLAADDAGRELVAWMGGAPPPPLKESAGEAPRAPDNPKAPGPEAQTGPGGTAAQQLDDASDLVDAFAAFEAAAAAVDRVVEDPAPAQPARAAPPRPPPAPPAFELDPPGPPEPAVASEPEPEMPLAEELPAAVEAAAQEGYALPAEEPAPPEEEQPAPLVERPPAPPAGPARTRNRPPPSRRPAPPPLPRPTLAPG